MTNMELGKTIKQLRYAKNITEEAICRKLGKTKGWLAARENGDVTISAEDLYVIFDALNESVDQLMHPIKENKSPNPPNPFPNPIRISVIQRHTNIFA